MKFDEAIRGYGEMMAQLMREGWSLTLLSFMFHDLAMKEGPALIHVMEKEVQKDYSIMLPRIINRPSKTKKQGFLPIWLGYPDRWVFKKPKKGLAGKPGSWGGVVGNGYGRLNPELTTANHGIHFHMIVACPPKQVTRMKRLPRSVDPITSHVVTYQRLYSSSGMKHGQTNGKRLARLHAQPIKWDPERVVDYILKALQNGKGGFDDVLILPRARSEIKDDKSNHRNLLPHVKEAHVRDTAARRKIRSRSVSKLDSFGIRTLSRQVNSKTAEYGRPDKSWIARGDETETLRLSGWHEGGAGEYLTKWLTRLVGRKEKMGWLALPVVWDAYLWKVRPAPGRSNLVPQDLRHPHHRFRASASVAGVNEGNIGQAKTLCLDRAKGLIRALAAEAKGSGKSPPIAVLTLDEGGVVLLPPILARRRHEVRRLCASHGFLGLAGGFSTRHFSDLNRVLVLPARIKRDVQKNISRYEA